MKRLLVLVLLLASVVSLNLAAPSATPSVEAYSCPPGVWYCQRNSQCRGFCGSGVPAEWEICFNGCCTCAG